MDDEANGVNSIPLGPKISTYDTNMLAPNASPELVQSVAGPSRVQQTQPTFMMASLSNKNKRKGFKQAMASTLPKKIVFEAPDGTAVMSNDLPALPFASASSAEVTAHAPSAVSRVIPPSEIQEKGQLPPNMIVTSIDVEEGLWPEGRKSKKKKPSRQALTRSETQEVENVVLNYGGGDEEMIPTQRDQQPDIPATKKPLRDYWDHVKKNWEKLPRVNGRLDVREGTLVTWQVSDMFPAV